MAVLIELYIPFKPSVLHTINCSVLHTINFFSLSALVLLQMKSNKKFNSLSVFLVFCIYEQVLSSALKKALDLYILYLWWHSTKSLKDTGSCQSLEDITKYRELPKFRWLVIHSFIVVSFLNQNNNLKYG